MVELLVLIAPVWPTRCWSTARTRSCAFGSHVSSSCAAAVANPRYSHARRAGARRSRTRERHRARTAAESVGVRPETFDIPYQLLRQGLRRRLHHRIRLVAVRRIYSAWYTHSADKEAAAPRPCAMLRGHVLFATAVGRRPTASSAACPAARAHPRRASVLSAIGVQPP